MALKLLCLQRKSLKPESIRLDAYDPGSTPLMDFTSKASQSHQPTGENNALEVDVRSRLSGFVLHFEVQDDCVLTQGLHRGCTAGAACLSFRRPVESSAIKVS